MSYYFTLVSITLIVVVTIHNWKPTHPIMFTIVCSTIAWRHRLHNVIIEISLNFHKLKTHNNLPKFFIQALLQQSNKKGKNKIHKECGKTPFHSHQQWNRRTELMTIHHKLHGSWFGHNSWAKFSFHRFVWNKHGCQSSTCTVWTLMSCALFGHECYMPVCIIYTWMLYVYSYCLHTKVMHMTFVFK